VVLSDDAGQFAIGQHALCWVHAERLMHKLDAFTDPHRAAQQNVRKLIWNFYADLKADKANPTNTAVLRYGRGSTASSDAAPALPPWIAFWRACMPTRPSC
jgi:hypothetical protein